MNTKAYNSAMSTPKAHLLSLPRELRDQIYSYLHHSVNFDWKWGTSARRTLPLHVCINNTPRLSVMLVCSCLHRELLDNIASLGLCIILQRVEGFWLFSPHSEKRRSAISKSVVKYPKFERVFPCVTRVRLQLSYQWTGCDWGQTMELLGVLRSRLPRLSHIVVMERIPIDSLSIDKLPDAPLIFTGVRLPLEIALGTSGPTPRMAIGLHLLQQLSYIRFEHFGNIKNLSHHIYRLEAYVFGKDSRHLAIVKEDMDAIYPRKQLPAELMVALSPYHEKTIEASSLLIWGCTDVRYQPSSSGDKLIGEEMRESNPAERESDEGFARWFDS